MRKLRLYVEPRSSLESFEDLPDLAILELTSDKVEKFKKLRRIFDDALCAALDLVGDREQVDIVSSFTIRMLDQSVEYRMYRDGRKPDPADQDQQELDDLEWFGYIPVDASFSLEGMDPCALYWNAVEISETGMFWYGVRDIEMCRKGFETGRVPWKDLIGEENQTEWGKE